MDGPEDYLTVDWESVREAVCGDSVLDAPQGSADEQN
jgi:hypothetical protein